MNKPNLMMVARELASYGENSMPVANALIQVLAAYSGKEPPASLPVPEGRSNNQRFNDLLNNCENPRAVYNALLAFAEKKDEVAV